MSEIDIFVEMDLKIRTVLKSRPVFRIKDVLGIKNVLEIRTVWEIKNVLYLSVHWWSFDGYFIIATYRVKVRCHVVVMVAGTELESYVHDRADSGLRHCHQ